MSEGQDEEDVAGLVLFLIAIAAAVIILAVMGVVYFLRS